MQVCQAFGRVPRVHPSVALCLYVRLSFVCLRAMRGCRGLRIHTPRPLHTACVRHARVTATGRCGHAAARASERAPHAARESVLSAIVVTAVMCDCRAWWVYVLRMRTRWARLSLPSLPPPFPPSPTRVQSRVYVCMCPVSAHTHVHACMYVPSMGSYSCACVYACAQYGFILMCMHVCMCPVWAHPRVHTCIHVPSRGSYSYSYSYSCALLCAYAARRVTTGLTA